MKEKAEEEKVIEIIESKEKENIGVKERAESFCTY